METDNSSLVSVIVPCYNSEKYLRYCLDSIINQTYRNIEIILVDDCATDGTGQIISEYIEADGRVKAIYHEKNMGLSVSRHDGFLTSVGGWICFVDNDDALHPQAIELLVGEADDEPDVVWGGVKAYQNDNFEQCEWENIEQADISVLEGEKLQEVWGKFGSIWGKLYRRSLFYKIDISKYREEFSWTYFEDAFLVSKLLMESRRWKKVENTLYRYRISRVSTSHRNTEHELPYCIDQMKAYEIILGEYKYKPNNAYLHGMEAHLLQTIKVWYMIDKYDRGRDEDLMLAEDTFNKWYPRYKAFVGKKNLPTRMTIQFFALSKRLCCVFVCKPWFGSEIGFRLGRIKS